MLTIGLAAYVGASAVIVGAGASIWTRRSRLRWCRERVRDAAMSVPEAVIVTDVRGTITTMNPRAESITGWMESDAVGQPIGEVFCLVDAQTDHPVVNPLVRALHKNIVVGPSKDALLLGRDGVKRHVREKAAPICDNHGRVFAGAVAFRSLP